MNARRASARWLAAALAGAVAGATTLPARSSQQSPASPTLEIEHEPLPCLATSTAPRVDAAITPGDRVASARAYWRIGNGPPAFYYTPMTATEGRFEALLPRVTAVADSIEYYIEASDRSGGARRTPSYVAPLVRTGCIARGIVPLVSGLGLTIGLTDPAQWRIPRGVNPADVSTVILPSGETVPAGEDQPAERRGAAAAAPRRGGVPKGVWIGAGVLAVGGIAAAAGGGGGGGGGGGARTPTPIITTPTPTATPTVTPTSGFRFAEAEATWSGVGDVDVLLLDAAGSPVTAVQTVPAGCESTASRTERVVLQGASAQAGGYQVRLTAKSCGAGTPTAISTLLTVQTDSGPKCPSTFVIVPVGQTVAGCTFTLP